MDITKLIEIEVFQLCIFTKKILKLPVYKRCFKIFFKWIMKFANVQMSFNS